MDLLTFYNSKDSQLKAQTWFVRHEEDTEVCCVIRTSIAELLAEEKTIGKVQLCEAINWYFKSDLLPQVDKLDVTISGYAIVVIATMSDGCEEMFYLSIAKEF